MSRAPAAIMLGHDYQMLIFWDLACGMMSQGSNIESIAYEEEGIDGYDDVTVRYFEGKPVNDILRGEKCHTDYYQVKFHMRGDCDITFDSFMDTSFLDTKTATMLSRLYKAWRDNSGSTKKYRLNFYTVRSVRSDDLLAKVYSKVNSGLELDKIFDNKKNSHMAKCRRDMISHIQKVEKVNVSDDELRAILKPLRLVTTPNYEQQLQITSDKLVALGYKPIQRDLQLNPYIDLLKNCYVSGETTFNNESLRKKLEKNDLHTPPNPASSICVRSYPMASDDKHHARLDLCQYFKGRELKDKYSWELDIYPQIVSFVNNLSVKATFELSLSTHLSIAYCLGQIIGTKKGYCIELIQNTINGPVCWKNTSNESVYPNIVSSSELLDDMNSEIALAIGIVNDITEDVKVYIDEVGLPIKRIIACHIDGYSGSTAIKDGGHTSSVANEISTIIRGLTPKEKRARLHVFLAAPVSLAYELGRYSEMFGMCITYEYNSILSTYKPAFNLPYKERG